MNRQDDDTRIDQDDESDPIAAAHKRMHAYNTTAAMLSPEQVKAAALESKMRQARYVAKLRAADRSGVPVERDTSRGAQMNRQYKSGDE